MKDKEKLKKKLEENLKKQKKYYNWWQQPPAKLLKQEFNLRLKLGQKLVTTSVFSR